MKPHSATFLPFLAVLMLTVGAASAADAPARVAPSQKHVSCLVVTAVKETSCAARCAQPDTAPLTSAIECQPTSPQAWCHPPDLPSGSHICACCPEVAR